MFNITNYIIPRSMHEQFFGIISPDRHTPNQTRAAIPSNTAQAILQQPASITQNATVSRELPSERPSNTQIVAQTILNGTPARPPLRDILNEWAGNNINKVLAADEILTCIRTESLRLSLRGLNLGSLPDVFGYQELQHLQTLDLSYNQLTALPESFGQLTALNELQLHFNRLTALPESFGQLTALQDLALGGNQLTALPESFSQLTALQKLYLALNQLTALPESFGQLTALNYLHLGYNRLTALPESFGQLTALNELRLNNNRLTALPESFGQLTALNELHLNNNRLRELPNFLRALNLQVYDLPFAVNIESITEEICRLAKVNPSEALKQLYATATDGDDGQKASLRAWVTRLKDTASAKASDANFYKSIVKILELASTNPPFAATFWNVIRDAATTCGDRLALSILDLDIARQLMTLDLEKHLQVADFLKRGVWTYDLLKEIAVDKALRLRAEGTHFDEIEVHLGYFIKLKEALNLPITMQDMLYFRFSTLTEDDLAAAKTHVLEQVGNEDTFVNFLIGQDQWKETLRIKLPEKFNEIQTAYEESEGDSSLEIFNNALKELTKELLRMPDKPLVF